MIGEITGTVGIVNGVNNDFVGVEPDLLTQTDTTNYFVPNLLSTSLNQIDAAGCTFVSLGENPFFSDGDLNLFDQIGAPRPDGVINKCDIGAIEMLYQYLYLPTMMSQN